MSILTVTPERFATVRAYTNELASRLSAEDCQIQSMPDASPTKWHLAHTSWFFETFLLEKLDTAFEAFDPSFRSLFNSYYNSVGSMHPRPERGVISRPSLDRIREYREQVDERVASRISMGLDEEQLAIVELGLHHEQQHQELILTDIKHAFSRNGDSPAYESESLLPTPNTAAADWLEFSGGTVSIGHRGDGFAFDNEGPSHLSVVGPFSFAARPVTNGEFLDFVEQGGYTSPEHWLSEGWRTVQESGWCCPLYWQKCNTGDWSAFTLHGVRELDLNAPVSHVSYYEAAAYANFRGARLPTESEWETAARDQPVVGRFSDGGRFEPGGEEVAIPNSQTPSRIYGDVWEWTASPYTAYPRYKPTAGALGEYNGKFMANQMVLRGGSVATSPGHLRATYRNFFPPEVRWQFSGIRLARDA